MKRQILNLFLGLSLCLPTFAQNNFNNKEPVKTETLDTTNVDSFVNMLIYDALYQKLDTIKRIGTKLYQDKLYSVKFDSAKITLKVVNLKPGIISTTDLVLAGDYSLFSLTGGDILFNYRAGHWYFVSQRRETNWFNKVCLPGIKLALSN